MQLTKPKVLAIAKESIDVGFSVRLFSKFVHGHTQHAMHDFLGGLGACTPRKFLKISSSQVESGGHFQLKSMLLSKTIG